MQVHRIADPAFAVNLYLVEADEARMVVDAGTGQAPDALLEEIGDHAGPGSVDKIYLTHWHHDHVGGAAALREATGAEVFVHEDEADAIREGDGRRTLGAMMGAGMEACPVTDLREGEALELGDVAFDILLLPGHSPAHTALWHEPSGTLVSGDVVFENGSFGRVDLPGGDGEILVESLERVADLEPEAFYPGHMNPVTEGAAEAAERSARRARMTVTGQARR
jgi:glyoxylase-like metal-dependent hydrolase (beta-lactamase superfamily II)